MTRASLALVFAALGMASILLFVGLRPKPLGEATGPTKGEDLQTQVSALRPALAKLQEQLSALEGQGDLPPHGADGGFADPHLCDRHCENLRAELRRLQERVDFLDGGERFGAGAPNRSARAGAEKRPYGPEQAIGAPDTKEQGHHPTAWASFTADGQDEWLSLEYEEPAFPTGLQIYETHNPGALKRVTVFTRQGREVDVWENPTPIPRAGPKRVTFVPIQANFRTNRVKLYLDSRSVPGWNEIDAVGMLDPSGRIQWARLAEASSTLADALARGTDGAPAGPTGPGG